MGRKESVLEPADWLTGVKTAPFSTARSSRQTLPSTPVQKQQIHVKFAGHTGIPVPLSQWPVSSNLLVFNHITRSGPPGGDWRYPCSLCPRQGEFKFQGAFDDRRA